MKYALIIGNNQYDDPKLAQLKTPAADSQALAKVLGDQSIGSFDEVTPLINRNESEIRRAISSFLNNKKPDDLVLVYFSGHGILDDRGRLFLSLKDTQTNLLKATAISSTFISDEMDSCRSKRQVLILDCCHSGAFARGTKGDPKAVTEATFEGSGYGRVVMTASDSMQYALEGDQVIRQTDLSLFTHFLLEGLKTGEADMDNDGHISLDEWYDYTYARVVAETPRQSPHRWSYNQQGDLIIARNPNARKKVAELPFELAQAVESSFTSIRESAVHELGKLLRSRDAELANLARTSLEKMMGDDSRKISNAAGTLLAAFDKARALMDAANMADPQPGMTPLSPESLMPVTASISSAEAFQPNAEKMNPPREQEFDNTFRAKWAAAVTLAVVSSILVFYYHRTINESLESLRILFGVATGLTGLVQWSAFRSRLGWWWVAANMVTGLGLGLFHKYLYENTGWGTESLLFLLAAWVIVNAVLGPVLMRETPQRSRGLSAIMESGRGQDILRLYFMISLIFASIANVLLVLEDYEFLNIFWTLYGISAILVSLSIVMNRELPRDFGFITLALFLFFDGFNVVRLAFNPEYSRYYFTLNGILAMVSGVFWISQKETWRNIGFIALSAYLIVTGASGLVVYDSEANSIVLTISILFSVPAAIFIVMRK
ncbi:MAG: hypothetical protein HOP27_15720 [Anaerolineales bacterium]|nr:hypothetical protein [Anaerolineales bacterium]